MSKELHTVIDNSSSRFKYPFADDTGSLTITQIPVSSPQNNGVSTLVRGMSTVMLSLFVGLTTPKSISSSLDLSNSIGKWHLSTNSNGNMSLSENYVAEEEIELDSPNWLESSIDELEQRNFTRVNDPRIRRN